MIHHTELENGNLCTLVEFGGDILVGSATNPNGRDGILTLSDLEEKVEIGKELPEYKNVSHRDMPNLIVLKFNRLESIDVVIKNLSDLKERIILLNETEGGKK